MQRQVEERELEALRVRSSTSGRLTGPQLYLTDLPGMAAEKWLTINRDWFRMPGSLSGGASHTRIRGIWATAHLSHSGSRSTACMFLSSCNY